MVLDGRSGLQGEIFLFSLYMIVLLKLLLILLINHVQGRETFSLLLSAPLFETLTGVVYDKGCSILAV